MSDEQTYIGEWWLPENESIRIAGTLTIVENKKFTLTLIGELKNKSWKIDKIVGIASKPDENRSYCFILYTNYKLNSSNIGYIRSKYSIFKLLKSGFKSVTEVNEFISFTIVSENFAKVHKLSSQKIDFGDNGNLKIEQKELEKFLLFENDFKKYFFQIGLSYTVNFYRSQFKNVSSVKVEYDKAVSLDQIKNDQKKLDCFFSLICDNATISTDITLFSENDSEIENKISFKLYQKNKLLSTTHNSAKNYETLFNLEEIKDNFDLIKFEDFYEKNEQLFGYFIDNKSNENLQTQNRFLNIVNALEIYSRKIEPDQSIKESHLDIRQNVLDKVSNNEKEWLKKRLKTIKRLNLKERLSHLSEKFLPENYNDFLDIDLDRIIETRHKFVHSNVRCPDLVINDEETLWVLTNKLEMLFSLIVFNESGLNKNQMKKAFDKMIDNRPYLN